jgi:hypothetical protein
LTENTVTNELDRHDELTRTTTYSYDVSWSDDGPPGRRSWTLSDASGRVIRAVRPFPLGDEPPDEPHIVG